MFVKALPQAFGEKRHTVCRLKSDWLSREELFFCLGPHQPIRLEQTDWRCP
jgi:hypothetical protein